MDEWWIIEDGDGWMMGCWGDLRVWKSGCAEPTDGQVGRQVNAELAGAGGLRWEGL